MCAAWHAQRTHSISIAQHSVVAQHTTQHKPSPDARCCKPAQALAQCPLHFFFRCKGLVRTKPYPPHTRKHVQGRRTRSKPGQHGAPSHARPSRENPKPRPSNTQHMPTRPQQQTNATRSPTTNLATRNTCETATCSCTQHIPWHTPQLLLARPDRRTHAHSRAAPALNSLDTLKGAQPLPKSLLGPCSSANLQQEPRVYTKLCLTVLRPPTQRHAGGRCVTTAAAAHRVQALNGRCPSKHSCLPALQETAAADGAAAASAAAATTCSWELHASFCPADMLSQHKLQRSQPLRASTTHPQHTTSPRRSTDRDAVETAVGQGFERGWRAPGLPAEGLGRVGDDLPLHLEERLWLLCIEGHIVLVLVIHVQLCGWVGEERRAAAAAVLLSMLISVLKIIGQQPINDQQHLLQLAYTHNGLHSGHSSTSPAPRHPL